MIFHARKLLVCISVNLQLAWLLISYFTEICLKFIFQGQKHHSPSLNKLNKNMFLVHSYKATQKALFNAGLQANGFRQNY